MQCFSLHGHTCTKTDRKRQLAKANSDPPRSSRQPRSPRLLSCRSVSLSLVSLFPSSLVFCLCLCLCPLHFHRFRPSIHLHLPSLGVTFICYQLMVVASCAIPRHSSGALLIASPTRTTTRSSRQQTNLWLVTIPSRPLRPRLARHSRAGSDGTPKSPNSFASASALMSCLVLLCCWTAID
ncbi:hypothetical protein GGI42DRAFT_130094 [Trichoderma sp. SZMC 28013]